MLDCSVRRSTPTAFVEVPVLTIGLIGFCALLGAMALAPFIPDSREMGIKTSEGHAGPEFDPPAPAPANVRTKGVNRHVSRCTAAS